METRSRSLLAYASRSSVRPGRRVATRVRSLTRRDEALPPPTFDQAVSSGAAAASRPACSMRRRGPRTVGRSLSWRSTPSRPWSRGTPRSRSGPTRVRSPTACSCRRGGEVGARPFERDLAGADPLRGLPSALETAGRGVAREVVARVVGILERPARDLRPGAPGMPTRGAHNVSARRSSARTGHRHRRTHPVDVLLATSAAIPPTNSLGRATLSGDSGSSAGGPAKVGRAARRGLAAG